MVARRHLGGRVHACFALHALHPRNARGPDALETSRFGAGFPEPRAVDADAFGGQGAGRIEYLFFGFGAAGAGNDQGTSGINPRECDRLKIVHGVDELFLFVFVFPCFACLRVFRGRDSGIRHIRPGSGSRWSAAGRRRWTAGSGAGRRRLRRRRTGTPIRGR